MNQAAWTAAGEPFDPRVGRRDPPLGRIVRSSGRDHVIESSGEAASLEVIENPRDGEESDHEAGAGWQRVGTALLEIGAVARQLGVAPSTLRTWERRYQLVIPRRGDQGQRLYDHDQIDLLGRILAQVQHGARARAAHALAGKEVPVRSARVCFEPSPQAPLRARRALDHLIAEVENDRFAFYLRLIASELVKNAVLYGSKREPIRMEATLYPSWIDLQVENRGGRLSMKSLRRRRREGGRGLEIVDALAQTWAIETGPLGTTITVRLLLEP